MLFGKRKRVVNRILIVEDEPLTAFDNEVMLGDLGYEVVATLDRFEDAIELLERGFAALPITAPTPVSNDSRVKPAPAPRILIPASQPAAVAAEPMLKLSVPKK